jgi:metal-sulfur cluster biosynthetic enzyme
MSEGHVLAALAEVRDPELDEPITSLGFVTSCHVSPDGDVVVRLRLPTPQCAPNFAFLMVADAREAVRRVPGVRRASVVLEDHFTGERINAAVAHAEGLAGAFPGETEDDRLDGLRALFECKALVARQGRVCEELLARGLDADGVCRLTVADLPDTPDATRCVELRGRLGIACDGLAPAFVLADGSPLRAGALVRWLRMARLVRTSLDVNGGVCRDLLRARHGVKLERTVQEVTR